MTFRDRFNRWSARLTLALGSPVAMAVAALLILGWAVSGPLFGFSDAWQLVINTTTTIITFLMVFVIQASQNRDSRALHLKLDEVIRAVDGARDELITTEQSTDEEVRQREAEFSLLARRAGALAPQTPGRAGAATRPGRRARAHRPTDRDTTR